MKLWIRSQDRQELIKASEINVYQYDESAGLGNDWHIFVRDYEVGVYKSKERALDVLDEIQNVMLCKTEEKYSGKGFVNELGQAYIYEMPEK